MQQDGTYCVSGELVFATVGGILQDTRDLFAGERITFNLAGVERADSAGLALLIEWMREAAQREMKIHFDGIPDQLRAIARASRLEHLIP